MLEALPVDALPEGVPAGAADMPAPDRGTGGRFQPGNASAARGGHGKAGRSRLASSLGLAGRLPDAHAFRSYRASGEALRRATGASLASTIGGGVVGPLPSTLVASGALTLAWSRYFFDSAAAELGSGDPSKAPALVALAAKLSEASSRLFREAWEYTAREAEAARARPNQDPLARWARPGDGDDSTAGDDDTTGEDAST